MDMTALRATTDTTLMSTGDLTDAITTLAGRLAAGEARLLELVAEFDAREAWAGPGMLSCAHWLSWRLGMGQKAAYERVRVARALRDLPVVAAAYSTGRLSWSQVRAVTRIATPADEQTYVDAAHGATGAQLERLVRGVRRARRLQDDAVAAGGSAVIAPPDVPAGAEPPRAPATAPDPVGAPAPAGVAVRDAEAPAAPGPADAPVPDPVRVAADAAAAPETPAAAPGAPALAAAPSAAGAPAGAPAPPTSVPPGAAALAPTPAGAALAPVAAPDVAAPAPAPAPPPAAPGAAAPAPAPAGPGAAAPAPGAPSSPGAAAAAGGSAPPAPEAPATQRLRARTRYDEDGTLVVTLHLPAEHGAVYLAAIEQACAELDRERRSSAEETPSVPSVPSVPSAVTSSTPALPPTAASPARPATCAAPAAPPHRATPAEGLLRLAERFLELVAGERPDVARRGRGRLVAQVDPLSGWSRLPDGELLPPPGPDQPGAPRLPVDVLRAVRPLRPEDLTRWDAGRSQREPGQALRDLLGTLDGERCRFPGCDRVHRLHAHHVRPWSVGGPTDLGNLVLLCGRHHTLVHRDGFHLRLDAGRDLTAHTADGVYLEHRPTLPRGDVDGLDPLREIDAQTLPAGGWGDRLDLDYAVSVLLHQAA